MEFVFFFPVGWGVGFEGMAKTGGDFEGWFVESFLVSIVAGYLLNGIGGLSKVFQATSEI